MEKPSTRRSVQEQDAVIRQGLASIYQTGEGGLQNASHLDVARAKRWKLWLGVCLASIALVGGIAWAVNSLLQGSRSGASTSVKLAFAGPVGIASGDEVSFELSYTNIDSVPLTNLELILRYPEGFTFSQAEPQPVNAFHTVWNLPDLAPGASGVITLNGKMVGAVNAVKTIDATLSYQPQNFSSIFKETAAFSSTITSSIVSLEIDGPAETLPEKKVTYTVTYRNTSDHPLANIGIQVTLPETFVIQKTDPTPRTLPDARNLPAEWRFERLDPRQEGQLIIEGGYVAPKTGDAQQSQDQQVKASVGFVDEQDVYSVQQEQTATTKLVQPGLSLQLILNGSTSAQPIGFGQTLTYTLAYKNVGSYELDDVTLSLTLEGDAVAWASLEDKHGGKRSGSTLTWNKDQISELDLVRPLAQGEITVSVDVKGSPTDVAAGTLGVRGTGSATLVAIGTLPSEDAVAQSNSIEALLANDLQFSVEGRYFSDDNIALGSGPLPPVVGETTTVRIGWTITSSVQELRDVVATTELPPGVVWAAKQYASVGALHYDATTRKVNWTIPKVASGAAGAQPSVWFDVSVTPTKEQARKLLILTDQVTITAVDAATSAQISKVAKAVTSNLEDDPIGGGKGIVVDITE